MTQDEIIEMARRAGFKGQLTYNWCEFEELEAFAKLVAEREREECAKVAEDFLTSGRSPLGRSIGNAIRARQ